MTSFTTRVQLINVKDVDYEELHDAMAAKRFTRTISGSEGTYHLPSAEYNFSGDVTRDEVLELAKSAAKSTGHKFRILVTESQGRCWYNLEKV